MLKSFFDEDLIELDVQVKNGCKKCPGKNCDAMVIKSYKHGCHHVTCTRCRIQFCYRCLNYEGDGSHYFTDAGGCPNPGCTPTICQSETILDNICSDDI